MDRAVAAVSRAQADRRLVDARRLPDHERERRETLLHQLPIAVVILLSCTYIWGAIEWVTRPHHRSALVLVDGLLLIACLGGLWWIRRAPQWVVYLTIFGVNAVIASVLIYSALVGGSGELDVIAITLLLGAVVALLPLGARNQSLASIAAVVGYPLALQLGVKTYLDPWYSLSGLAAAVGVAALGAGTTDRYRRRILDHAATNARLVQEATRAHEAKSDFLATIAHELRNPLGGILGYIDMLRDGVFTDPADVDDTLKRIRSQALGMLDMLQNLLDIDKIEAGHARLESSDVELSKLLDELRASLPPSWQKQGVALVWKAPAAAVTITTDRGKLLTILRNLIHNAIKYTHAGEVTVAAKGLANGGVTLSVTDTGEGIPADDLQHIFDRFRQTSNPTRGGGVGLGLHIVKRFSEALGATVEVSSERGRGSSFVLTLPNGSAPR